MFSAHTKEAFNVLSSQVGPQQLSRPFAAIADAVGGDRTEAARNLSGTDLFSNQDVQRVLDARGSLPELDTTALADDSSLVIPEAKTFGAIATRNTVSSLSQDNNDSLATAENLDELTGTDYRLAYVGNGSDTADYYRFELTSARDVYISLTGLEGNANINLIHDKNNNNQIDAGETIAYSRRFGTVGEAISAHALVADDNYYVEVYANNGQESSNTLGLTPSTPSSTVDVTINEIRQIDMPREFRADYYAKVTIDGGTEQVTDYIQNDTHITPNWSFQEDTTGAYVPITLKVYDDDWGSDDHIDINPVKGAKDVTVYYHTHTGKVYGPGVYGNEGDVITFKGSGDKYRAQIQFTIDQTVPEFTRFDVSDASDDFTSSTVFQGGAIETDFTFTGATSVPSNVVVEAWKNGQSTILGTWSNEDSVLNEVTSLQYKLQDPGNYDIRAVATLDNGAQYFSNFDQITVLEREMLEGDEKGQTLNYSAATGSGTIVMGRGGTDTLNLSGISSNDVSHLNNWYNDLNWNPPLLHSASLSSLNNRQAVFGGTSFDFLKLDDGREIYFQGIEKLKFNDGVLDLAVTPNDTLFNRQWNLHAQDVPSAWRFTKGSESNVLLVSLDTGVLTPMDVEDLGVVDIDLDNRLRTDPNDDDNTNVSHVDENGSSPYGHGHNAIGIMAATHNNMFGAAGINWNSDVYVADVYNPGTIMNQLSVAMYDAINFARQNNMKVVFQGGIQGDDWEEDHGEAVSQIMNENSDIAFMAVAAGNEGGNPETNPIYNERYLTTVSGLAKLADSHKNIVSVGALKSGFNANVDGFANAGNASLAGYSNRGSNLSLVAATDSPVMNKLGVETTFGGTSAANPNAAGIASLVWSANTSLTGEEVGQILEYTATDLGDAGRDDTFGHGLVNADAAVRRAKALKQNAEVANLYPDFLIFS